MAVKFTKSFMSSSEHLAADQLLKLLVYSDVCIIFNNYKSNLSQLNLVRNIIIENGGLMCQPNKKLKTRSFEGLGSELTSNTLGGFAIFTFFKKTLDAFKFLTALSVKNLIFVRHYSTIINGHLLNSRDYSLLATKSYSNLLVISLQNLNNLVTIVPTIHLFTSLIILQIILNAYIKSIS